MKKLILAFIFFCPSSLAITPKPYDTNKLRELETDWSLLSFYELKEVQKNLKIEGRELNMKLLEVSKNLLLQGNTEKAIFLLKKINRSKSKIGPVITRLLATAHFIEGNHKKVVKLLSKETFQIESNLKEICIMKITSLIALNDMNNIRNEINKCKKVTSNYNFNDHMWLSYMEKFLFNDQKKGKLSDFQTILESKETVRIWLKSGLYTNREEYVSRNINKIPTKLYSSNEIRELIGLIYYRNNDLLNSKKFIEDLTGPNSENIKGNINLKKGKNELAFGHFKLALREKPASKSSIDRLLPLSWKLKRWKEGADFLKNAKAQQHYNNKKTALQIALDIKQQNFENAKKGLHKFNALYEENLPLEMNLMNSQVQLYFNQKSELESSLSRACKQYDGLSCWLQLQTLIWKDLSFVSSRTDKTPKVSDFFLEGLKESQKIIPLIEKDRVDQKDIEELDGKDVYINQSTNL